MKTLINKEFCCQDCGPIKFYVTFSEKSKEAINEYKHICSWCGSRNVNPTGLEEIIENDEIVTYLNGQEIKRKIKTKAK